MELWTVTLLSKLTKDLSCDDCAQRTRRLYVIRCKRVDGVELTIRVVPFCLHCAMNKRGYLYDNARRAADIRAMKTQVLCV